MIRKTWALVTILGISFGCNTRTQHTADDSLKPGRDVTAVDRNTSVSDDQYPPGETLSAKLASGLYRGGLRLAIDGNVVSGYYEDASGWNEEVGAPQFWCEYSFTGTYKGSDTIPLTLSSDSGATGSLEILSSEKIRVSLSRSPCNNEEPVTEEWEIADAYPLIAIKNVVASRSDFYSSPDESARRKAYLVRGDRAEIMEMNGEWYRVRYYGATATTEGWMPATAFEGTKVSATVLGKWLSKPGQPYELYYGFYSNGRYKTWSINSMEPQGMTGSYSISAPGIISLQPCGQAAINMPFRNPAAGELSMKLPNTDRWLVFASKPGGNQIEEADFLIEKRQIVTSVNGRIIHIPSSATKAEFLEAVCPFDATPDVLRNGEGTFDILRISSAVNGALFYAVLDGNDIGALVIDRPVANWKGITVGATFGELKNAIPSVTVDRSEIEGRIVGSVEDFSFSFGHLGNALFNANAKSIPDSVKIKQIIL